MVKMSMCQKNTFEFFDVFLDVANIGDKVVGTHGDGFIELKTTVNQDHISSILYENTLSYLFQSK